MRDQEAVTPVVGTLLVLGITVVGMAGVLAWGAPTIEAIQARNAQAAIIGEFEEIRGSAVSLSIPDASRIPTVALPRGTLSIEQGTRLQATAGYAAGCDLRVGGWADATPATVRYTAGGCAGSHFEVLQVLGSNTVLRARVAAVAGPSDVTIPSSATFTPDVTQGDWLFRLSNGLEPAIVFAEAWLMDNDRLAWDLGTGGGGVAAAYDLGAVFAADGPAVYVEKGPSLQENDLASGVYSLRVRTLSDGGGISAVSGRGTAQVFLGLAGHHLRIDREDVHRLRFDVHGDLGEAWCNLLLLRNQSLPAALGDPYVEDPAAPCAAPATDIHSVSYVPATVPFAAEVLHAEIRVTLTQ